MFRRTIPLLMALAIALAPVALDACRALCAGQESAATSGHYHHSGASAPVAVHGHMHHQSATLPLSSARAVPQACLRGDDLPSVVGASVHTALSPPAVASTLLDIPAPTERRASAS